MHTITKFVTLVIVVAASVGGIAPAAFAASRSSLEVSGWIPYWRTEAGTKDAQKNLSVFTELNPFAFSVKMDGTLADTLNIENSNWQKLIKDARRKKIDIIPTVMWSDTQNIHAILSNPVQRAVHIAAIVDMVEKGDFDGVDIDYEGKLADTRPHFSAFLHELGDALDGKRLHCTIEARMPIEARFVGAPPANIEYANDLPEINKACDRVRIMTYDQQTADVQLNAAARAAGDIYAPVADVAWVEKVVEYMAQDIDKEKMSLGVATYGYIYQLMPNSTSPGFSYIKMEAFNPGYATDLAKKLRITPERNRAGELSFTHVPKDQVASLPTQKELERLAPRGTTTANLAAAGALALLKREGRQAPIEYLTWSDAGAIEQKVDLAKRMGLAGVSIFKIDGGVDPAMWRVLR